MIDTPADCIDLNNTKTHCMDLVVEWMIDCLRREVKRILNNRMRFKVMKMILAMSEEKMA
jgi:hypothetical protein